MSGKRDSRHLPHCLSFSSQPSVAFLRTVRMRSPSICSQDDPISAALKPSATETEAERTARLYAEAEAKRVSEQIDEHLREERERLKKRKGDVKVVCYKIKFAHIFTCKA